MTAGLPPGALMGADTVDSLGRYELGIDRWKVLRRFERESAAPESYDLTLCPCGRCGGRGTLRITTAGVEEWVPCRMVGNSGYLPDRDAWKR